MWLQNPYILATLVGVVIIALYCLSAVMRAYAQRRRYLHALATVQSGAQTPIAAYQAYLRASPTKVPVWARVVGVIGQVLLGVTMGTIAAVGAITEGVLTEGALSGGTAGSLQSLIGASAFQAILLALLLFALAQGLSDVLLTTLNVVWAVAPASARLRGLPTRTGDLTRQRVKNVAAYTLLPLLVLVVSIGVAFAGAPIWVAIAVWGVGQITVTAFLALNRGAILRWLYPCAPIEQTEWAAVGSRIQAWAQLAGTPLRAIYLRRMAPYGTADWAITGLGRQSLYVNDVFLAATDWRQHDAYTGLLLGVGRNLRRAGRQRLILDCVSRAAQVGALGYLIYSVIAQLSALVVSLISGSPTVDNGAQNATNIIIAILLVLGITFIHNALVRQLTRSGKTAHLDADHASVDLVGDPLALLAALYLIWDYPSGDLQRLLVNDTEAQQRVAALQQRLSVPGPFAPWFYIPIPSPIPVTVGPYLLSVPPTPQTLAAPPPPVPTARYPVSAPIPFAPLPYAPMPFTPVPALAPTPPAEGAAPANAITPTAQPPA